MAGEPFRRIPELGIITGSGVGTGMAMIQSLKLTCWQIWLSFDFACVEQLLFLRLTLSCRFPSECLGALDERLRADLSSERESWSLVALGHHSKDSYFENRVSLKNFFYVKYQVIVLGRPPPPPRSLTAMCLFLGPLFFLLNLLQNASAHSIAWYGKSLVLIVLKAIWNWKCGVGWFKGIVTLRHIFPNRGELKGLKFKRPSECLRWVTGQSLPHIKVCRRSSPCIR